MSAWGWYRFTRIAARKGEAPALVQGQIETSFAALHTAALAWGAALDVAPGARVVVSGENSAEFVSAILGIWSRGAIPVLVHADAPSAHLAHATATTGADLVVTDRDDTGDPGAPVLTLDRPCAVPDYAPRPRASGDAPASILFTSGSTGRPKGVVQSAANLISGADRVAGHLGYRADDRLLCPIPFAFDYGWGQLLTTIFRGLPLILPAPRNAFGLCEALGMHAPTVLAGVPAVFSDLLVGLAPVRDTPRGSVRLITNTGSRIPRGVYATLREVFPDAALSLNYGLTETFRTATLPCELAPTLPDCVGFPVPGVDVAVLRVDATPCAPDEEGEIVHRGAGAFLGYWGDPEATARTLRPDPLWPHLEVSAPRAVFTGDLGHLDTEGRLFIHGRSDRQLKVMGVRVSPDEVETLLLAADGVASVAITSVPHDMLGDKIVANVVLTEAIDQKTALKALKRHARQAMSPYMQPREWRFLPALPRTPSGKTDYPELKRRTGVPA
ncbi:class I adenylate-forming enzyme family protein [Roseobacter sp.]|uniref:class I adenylate-forming enzyme family protein n=1 Tax=Roseobacter sp. TaxID=1907202 RepID=UPI00385F92F0